MTLLLEELGSKHYHNKDILLGYRTGGNGDEWTKYVYLPYQPFDSIGIISRTGYGKSVLLKRIYSYILKNTGRNAIIFDLQSEDHWRSKYANTSREGFAKNEERFGIPNLHCYAPIMAKEDAHKFDTIFGIKIQDTVRSDWIKLDKDGIYSLTGKGSALLFSKIDQEDTTDIHEVLDEMEATQGNRVVVNAATNALADIKNQHVFLENKSRTPHIYDFSPLLEQESVVINFHQSEEFMGLYLGVILRNLYEVMRSSSRKRKSLQPVIIIEEADLALNKQNGSMIGCNKWVMEILRRARKYKGLLVLSTQQASDLYGQVKNHIKTWIVGDLVPADLDFFQGYFSEEVMEALKHLNTRPNDYGAREWLLVQNMKYFDRFRPFNSPVEIHRT